MNNKTGLEPPTSISQVLELQACARYLAPFQEEVRGLNLGQALYY